MTKPMEQLLHGRGNMEIEDKEMQNMEITK